MSCREASTWGLSPYACSASLVTGPIDTMRVCGERRAPRSAESSPAWSASRPSRPTPERSSASAAPAASMKKRTVELEVKVM